jgi:hypothetical protein
MAAAVLDCAMAHSRTVSGLAIIRTLRCEPPRQTELSNSHLAISLLTMPKAPIVADSAELKSVAELQTRRSTNLHHEYENYAWKVNKDGETVGIEDPRCANHLMSAVRYGLTALAAASATDDPRRENRERIEVAVTRRRLTEKQLPWRGEGC